MLIKQVNRLSPKGSIENMKIAILSLDIQKSLLSDLKKENKLIEAQKEIISMFQDKITNKLNSIWQSEETKSSDNENKPVADKSVVDMLINKASKLKK